MHRTLL